MATQTYRLTDRGEPLRNQGLGFSKLAMVVGYIVIAALLITAGNSTERDDIPLFFVAGLIILVDRPFRVSVNSRGHVSRASRLISRATTSGSR